MPKDIDLLFTQTEGFVDFEVPERLRCGEKESWDQYKERVGLKHEWRQDRGCGRRYLDEFFTEETTGSAVCDSITSASGDEPRFRVEVQDAGIGGADWEVVWVKTRGDLLALRIKLAQLMSAVETTWAFSDLLMLAKRTFMRYHEHDPDEVCSECAPDEHKRRQKALSEAREKKLKAERDARLAVIVNTDRGWISISYERSEADAHALLASLHTKKVEVGGDPSTIRLVLLLQGSKYEHDEALKALAGHRWDSRKQNVFNDHPEVRTFFNNLAKRHRQEEPFPVNLWTRLGAEP